jgi:hypothetical protein
VQTDVSWEGEGYFSPWLIDTFWKYMDFLQSALQIPSILSRLRLTVGPAFTFKTYGARSPGAGVKPFSCRSLLKLQVTGATGGEAKGSKVRIC